MRNKKGITLVELLVSMIVASILILTVGVLSSTANRSFKKLTSKQQIYNDISYGFKLTQNKVRASSGIGKVLKPNGTPWRSDKLVIGISEFGIYRNGTSRDFVFIPDLSSETTQEKILSVPDSNDSDSNLVMSINCDCTRASPTTYNCSNSSCTVTPKSVTLVLTGTKDNIPFDMETTILKRN